MAACNCSELCCFEHPALGGLVSSSKSRRVCTATLGLVVHAAADGIALGAAAASHHSDVEFIVFFAIMLHKAPTAFGLTSFLLKEGNDSRKINKLLLVFSLAAPAGAIITYIIVGVLGSSSMSDSVNTSKAMLFSAGTFLYVATVHILPDIMNAATPEQDSPGQLSFLQLTFLIVVDVLSVYVRSESSYSLTPEACLEIGTSRCLTAPTTYKSNTVSYCRLKNDKAVVTQPTYSLVSYVLKINLSEHMRHRAFIDAALEEEPVTSSGVTNWNQ
ncbi:Zinc/iron permease [Trinorchestia longiramus]|nr:Zinc/iron permease [Trinorchestia longiramus]